ncbi:protein-L-isoaspartate(D-aspartate) O-methyltransferase [Litorivicinus lipolyticus]|uniref:Protein-L-isoaspartate O-methyltransferase n=1 Tax=Litorivicinus lipolyticus TaxID=418701 RepID=A0A5Q2QGX8_9GAMM|nr:protein-L-isoaspartate(D-aspartate) O-methyltransferase [Litorivicinus lipolyticus]
MSRDANTEARHRLVGLLQEQGITNQRVLNAFWQVPRHQFIEPALQFRAYEDVTLPIGFQQTLSRPSVVAFQLQRALSRVPKPRFILEIGSGSGYQTALLTHLCLRVYSVERIAGLHQCVDQRLRGLGQRNFRLRHGDGFDGWAQHGPFEVIIAAACAPQVPEAWLEQLAPGGVMLMPIEQSTGQAMLEVHKTDDGEVHQMIVNEASFVPCLPGKVG